MTLDELILQQQEASANAKHWQERDRELRSLIWGEAFGSKGCEDGTQHTQPLGKGYKLKGKRPVNYKLEKGEALDLALDELEKCGNEGPFLAERIVKFEPKLSVSEYKKLSGQQRAIIDKVLTTTPGLPEIELVEPK